MSSHPVNIKLEKPKTAVKTVPFNGARRSQENTRRQQKANFREWQCFEIDNIAAGEREGDTRARQTIEAEHIKQHGILYIWHESRLANIT